MTCNDMLKYILHELIKKVKVCYYLSSYSVITPEVWNQLFRITYLKSCNYKAVFLIIHYITRLVNFIEFYIKCSVHLSHNSVFIGNL